MGRKAVYASGAERVAAHRERERIKREEREKIEREEARKRHEALMVEQRAREAVPDMARRACILQEGIASPSWVSVLAWLELIVKEEGGA